MSDTDAGARCGSRGGRCAFRQRERERTDSEKVLFGVTPGAGARPEGRMDDVAL